MAAAVEYRALIDDWDGKSVFDEKYIVVYVTGRANGAVPLVLLYSGGRDYHAQLLSQLQERHAALLEGENWVVHGGGIITLSPASRALRTYGRSFTFGRPVLAEVQGALAAQFSDWTRDVTITNEVRG